MSPHFLYLVLYTAHRSKMPPTMPTPARPLSRRLLLRGAGVAMALPWLEAMSPARAAAAFPKRFAVLFMGNGINANHWWAKPGNHDPPARAAACNWARAWSRSSH